MKDIWLQLLEKFLEGIDKWLQEQKTSRYQIIRLDNRKVTYKEVTTVNEEDIVKARERVFRKTPGLMKHHVQSPAASEGDSNA
ncbi:MAG: hypothetical protein HC876_20820 [Chloroflexaceae bacterium]|nr:hypothetical protein [bacterium]NJO07763.1 hypothetical protein [Chloroflexaceae bacterium]